MLDGFAFFGLIEYVYLQVSFNGHFVSTKFWIYIPNVYILRIAG